MEVWRTDSHLSFFLSSGYVYKPHTYLPNARTHPTYIPIYHLPRTSYTLPPTSHPSRARAIFFLCLSCHCTAYHVLCIFLLVFFSPSFPHFIPFLGFHIFSSVWVEWIFGSFGLGLRWVGERWKADGLDWGVFFFF